MLYIAHPYSDDPEKRLKQVDKICKEVREEGYIPISPLHMFSFMKETPEIRNLMMDICLELIDWSIETNQVLKEKGYDIEEPPYVRFYDYGTLSDGENTEYVHCYKHKYIMEFEKRAN